MKTLAGFRRTLQAALFFSVLYSNCAAATAVRVTVNRAAEVPFAKALLVVVSLETGREVAREFTGGDGSAAFELTKGLYQVYVAYPVSHYSMRVFELSIGNELQREVRVLLLSTGILETVAKTIAKRRVQFVDDKGQPLANREILLRDVQGSDGMQRWYKTDEHGSVDVSVLVFPTICVTVEDLTVLSGTLTNSTRRVKLQKQNLSAPDDEN